MVAITATCLLAWATSSSPGIIASLAAFTLALHRRSLVLFGCACLFLVGFTVSFYYSLSLTLLAKSGILVGSGLILLLGRLYIAWRAPSLSEAAP